MQNVRFTRDYEVRLDSTRTKLFPAGWAGEVDDKTAADAIKLKAAAPVTSTPVEAALKPANSAKSAK